jgi:RimJ/RimL family protein N-acetyltransferase
MDLVVRELTDADAEALTRAVHASLDHLRAWMPWAADEPHDAAWRRGFLRESARRGDRVYGAFLGDEVVGCCGLHPRIGDGGREIGYWVAAGHVRRGIATAMARQMVQTAFADPAVTHVEIHHDARNVASEGVPEKLGFARTGARDAQGHVVWRLERGAPGSPAAPR